MKANSTEPEEIDTSVPAIEDELNLGDLVLHIPGCLPQPLDDRDEVPNLPVAIQTLDVPGENTKAKL